jgi:hypothetical protein
MFSRDTLGNNSVLYGTSVQHNLTTYAEWGVTVWATLLRLYTYIEHLKRIYSTQAHSPSYGIKFFDRKYVFISCVQLLNLGFFCLTLSCNF